MALVVVAMSSPSARAESSLIGSLDQAVMVRSEIGSPMRALWRRVCSFVVQVVIWISPLDGGSLRVSDGAVPPVPAAAISWVPRVAVAASKPRWMTLSRQIEMRSLGEATRIALVAPSITVSRFRRPSTWRVRSAWVDHPSWSHRARSAREAATARSTPSCPMAAAAPVSRPDPGIWSATR